MYDIITIGSATSDVFLRSKGFAVVRSHAFKTGVAECIASGSKIEVSDIHFTVGGSAANTAVTFARQGFRTACLARVGKDIRGIEVAKTLRNEGVNVQFMQHDPKRMTAYSAVLLALSGERSILVYRGALEYLAAKEISWSQLRARWFYITHLAGKSASLFAKAIRFAAQHNIHVAVNPGAAQLSMSLRALMPLLKHIDIFIVNREEASYLTKIPYAKIRQIFKTLDKWVKGIVVMTDGPNGVIVSDGRRRWNSGVLKEHGIADRTGAGDAFGSGFLVGYIRKKDISYAIRFGSANATSVIEHIGAQAGILHKNDSIYRWGRLKITQQYVS